MPNISELDTIVYKNLFSNGTDLCLLASITGCSAYVIDFHLFRKSAGTYETNFYAVTQEIINSYRKKLSSKILRTPCTMLILTRSKILNYIFNRKQFYSIKKRYNRIMEKHAN